MPTILIVDDDAVDREQATRCLKPIENLHILQARDGREALEALARQTPDLVLTDLRMPGMDGLELVDGIRQEHPSVPVILMTSRGNEQLAVRALQAGAASYVPKRSLKEDLCETVQQVLEVAATGRSRQKVLRHLTSRETGFDLINDPDLVTPLVGFLQDGLEGIGFAGPTVRTQVAMALTEAISNAMIHGNLEVSSDLRDRSIESYYQEIVRRRTQEPYAGRRVHLTAKETVGRIEYVIRDEGPGFQPSSVFACRTGDDLMKVRGRGLMLIRTFMDVVEHNPRGNQITLAKMGSTPPAEER